MRTKTLDYVLAKEQQYFRPAQGPRRPSGKRGEFLNTLVDDSDPRHRPDAKIEHLLQNFPEGRSAKDRPSPAGWSSPDSCTTLGKMSLPVMANRQWGVGWATTFPGWAAAWSTDIVFP